MRAPSDRAAYLAEVADSDPFLRKEVESFVEAYEDDPSFIEAPAMNELRGMPMSRVGMLPVGEAIGPYRVTRLIASGGMGAVYEAVRSDDAYRKRVAIKIIRPDPFADSRQRDELLRRFRAERQALANLEHPNIARLFDGGATSEGIPYLVMEFIEGLPIDQYCDEKRLSIAARLRLFRDSCAAVQYAHQSLIVHRDLKPGNILVDEAGTVKLLDFGIAKLLDSDSSALAGGMTQTSAQPMTPAYASPEQIRGRHVTTASDVYSLGVVLYELLTGHRPYDANGGGPIELARLICDAEPPRPSVAVSRVWRTDAQGGSTSSLKPEDVSRTREGAPTRLRRRLAGDLDMIVLTALRKEPDRRYESAAAFSEDIRRHLDGEPVAARKGSWSYRGTKFVRRHRVGVLAASFAAISLLTGTAVAIWQASKANFQALEARKDARVAHQIAGFWTQFYRPEESGRPDLPSVDWSRRSRKAGVTLDALLEGGIQRIPTFDERPLVEAELRENMAQICNELHRFDESLPLHQQVLTIRRKALGPDHRDTLRSVSNVGFTLMMLERWEEAKTILVEALETGGRVWGPSAQDTLGTMRNLGYVESRLGQKDKAEAHFREALTGYRSELGEDHEHTLRAMNSLGKLLSERRRFKEAEEMLRQTVNLSTSHRDRGPNHPDTLEAANNLAGVLYAEGKLTEAIELFQQVYEGCRGALPPGDPLTLKAGNNLAHCLMKGGHMEQAVTILANVVPQAEKLWPGGTVDLAIFRGNYGECLSRLGRCDEAGRQLSAAYSFVEARLGPDHDLSRKTILRLKEHRHRCGDIEKPVQQQNAADSEDSEESEE